MKTMEKIAIDGIEKSENMTKVTLSGVPDRPGMAGEIFGALGQKGISVELLVTNPGEMGRSNISFAILNDDVESAQFVLEEVKKTVSAERLSFQPNMALIAIHGQHLIGVPGVAGKMFHALASNGINIDSISSSRTGVTCLIAQEHVTAAEASLHSAFALSTP
jgi:aspartate kinase